MKESWCPSNLSSLIVIIFGCISLLKMSIGTNNVFLKICIVNFCEIHLLFCWCSSYPIFGTEERFTLSPLCSQLCQVNGNGYPPGEWDLHSTRSSSPRINPTPWLRVTTENHNSHTFTGNNALLIQRETEQGEFWEGSWFPRASRSPPTSDTRWWSAGTAPVLVSSQFFLTHNTRDRMQLVVGKGPFYTRSNRTKEHVLSLKQEDVPTQAEASYNL